MISKLVLDKEGIWVDGSDNMVDYPSLGNEQSFMFENDSFWFKHRNNVISKIINRFPFQFNFADVGGGNGFQADRISNEFTEKTIYLIEPGYDGCRNAKKRGLENVYNMPFEHFDFTSKMIGGVGLFDVIEHINDHTDFVRKLSEKLTIESNLYITVPAHQYLWSDVDDFSQHYRRYDHKMFIELAKSTNLKLTFFSYFFSYLPLLTFLLRSLPYKIRGPRTNIEVIKQETNQHNPSRIVSAVFKKIESWELNKLNNSLMKRGASCIAVLSK